MPTLPTAIYTNDQLEAAYGDKLPALELPVSLADGTYLRGTLLGRSTAVAANEVQTITITGTPTGGTFTLSFTNPWTGEVETTAAIAYNAAASAVQAALLALNAFESGDLVASGGAFPGTAVVITFGGRYANRPVTAISATGSFTGGSSPAVAVAETTAGVVPVGTFGRYATSNSDGTGTARAILKYGCRVVLGRIYRLGDHGEGLLDAPAFFTGAFDTSKLVGLDSDAVTDLGARYLYGDATAGILRIP
jgi:hypothetical protein